MTLYSACDGTRKLPPVRHPDTGVRKGIDQTVYRVVTLRNRILCHHDDDFSLGAHLNGALPRATMVECLPINLHYRRAEILERLTRIVVRLGVYNKIIFAIDVLARKRGQQRRQIFSSVQRWYYNRQLRFMISFIYQF